MKQNEALFRNGIFEPAIGQSVLVESSNLSGEAEIVEVYERRADLFHKATKLALKPKGDWTVKDQSGYFSDDGEIVIYSNSCSLI